ncbi:hypothetical protein GGX14DRAFT_647342 [Mycena pura]|uniref:C3H1-type domain-containing protein n=1 Tax=Mycena pura TaxID=153505 RepID=A0AAD6Y9X8_9AGAR|nr:hypothetical protein GGX14DRAFT_647342 [Mycena pura]
MPSAERSASPDDRDQDEGRGGGKKSAKTKDLSHVPCKFFKVGSCTAGSSCPFSHSMVEPGAQKDVCAWFVKGNCKFGHKCALAHILPGQSMAMDRKNKKAAQIAAGGAKNGDGKSRGGSKRDPGNSARNPLLTGGASAPARTRPPMNMPLKATISPSAPAPPLKDTDFASFAALDEPAPLPTAPARKKSPSPTTPSPTLPVSAPSRPSTSTSPAKDFGPIGSPPSSATSPASRMHSGTSPSQGNGFLSTSPFSAPGSQSVFLSYPDPARNNMAASLGAGPTGWGGPNGTQVLSSPLRASLLSAGRANGINGESDDSNAKTRRKQGTLEDSSEDLEDFIPSSLTDLLTPEERSRRMSRTNSGQSPGFESSSPHRHGLGVPLGHSTGHRYSRSVPAPSLLGGDLKSIWSPDVQPPPPANSQTPASAHPPSPMRGQPSSYTSASGFDAAAAAHASSFADDGFGGRLPSLSPSNASAAFLPGIHHYIAQNKQPRSGPFASNAAQVPAVPPGLAAYLQAGPSASREPSPYVRPNPFDLTQQPRPGAAGVGGDALSPGARALQAHAPGQSLPQGLAAGYSRIHALPPLPSAAGSPSPAGMGMGLGTSPGHGQPQMRDWASMSVGSASFGGSPAPISLLAGARQPPGLGAPTATGAKSGIAAAANTGTANAGLDAMFSRLSYSAAAARTAATGTGIAPAMSRNPSGGSGRYASGGGAPLSPLSKPVVTQDDDLFALDE